MKRRDNPRPERSLCLRLGGESPPVDLPLRQGDTRLGSERDNEIVLDSTGVSRRHAVFHLSGPALSVEDCWSKNGTFVNGVRVQTASLHEGDILRLGAATLTVATLDHDDTLVAAPPKLQVTGGKRLRPAKQAAAASTAAARQVPEGWLALARRLNRSSATHDSVGYLSELVRGLEAKAAVLLEAGDGHTVTVRACAGALSPEEIERLRLVIPSALDAARGRAPDPYSYVDNGDMPLVLAVANGGGAPARVLSLVGEFPGREAAGGLLELVLAMMDTRQAVAQPTPARPGPGRLPDLVFPPGYVRGSSEIMRTLYQEVRHALRGDAPVLITGESGAGKEPVAHMIHISSHRAAGPFVAFNCAAIPADLLESELFGIEAGVATGVLRREGKLTLASGGVMFLDEIGEMAPEAQAKLLRALEQREVTPVGGRRAVKFDARIVAATNSDLRERMGRGHFRADLYWRVAGCTLHVPPLRSRRSDIPALVHSFIERFAEGRDASIRGISPRALCLLGEAPWPGNVRELQHEVERLVNLCPPGQAITSSLISQCVLAPENATSAAAPDPAEDLTLAVQTKALERRLVAAALQRSNGNQSRAARLLGITRNGLAGKLKKLGLETT